MATHSKLTQAQWQHHIDTWQSSRLSQKAYCQGAEISLHQFGYWRRKLRTAAEPDAKKNVSALVPVTRSEPLTARHTTGLSVTLASGVVIQGIEPGNMSLVTELIGQLS